MDLGQWSLVESNSDKRPHRTDHTLTWQQKTPLDASSASTANSSEHAFARVELVVLGDEVTDYRTYIKIPDEWRRKHEELTLGRIVFGYAIPILFVIGVAVTPLLIFLKNLRSDAPRSLHWQRVAPSSLLCHL